MSDVVDQFYARTHDQRINSAGGILGECVSGVQNYTNIDLGIGGAPAFPVAFARQMAGVRGDAFTWVPNTPDGVPPRGSIVVFNGNVGGGAGHTGVVTDANKNTLNVYQQNDPYGSGMHVKQYNYSNVVGWLIPKNLPQPSGGGDGVGVPNEQYDAVVVDNYNKGVEINNLKNAITELNKQIDGLNKQITDLKKQLDAKPISTDTKWETFKSLIRELIK